MIRSHFRLAGHPIHPMLIPFPIAFLTGGLIFDALYWGTGNGTWFTVATWMLVSGMIGAVAAGSAGIVDFLSAIPTGTRAKAIATAHMLVNTVAATLFFVTMVLHLTGDAATGSLPGVVTFVNFIGVVLIAFGAWLGGELVYREHVGVVPTHAGERDLPVRDERAA